MANVGLIFTTDYEIFGNGTGSVEHCMIKPTEKMARMLESVGAKLTVFFDVCEYWAFEKEYSAGKLKRNWAGMIKDQLQDLVQRGHDVQLHFHPQWLDYSFDGENWSLNYDLWRIGKLNYVDKFYPERGLRNLFAKGKETIEQIIKEVTPEYKCQVFRAGAWSIQPEGNVLRAMRDNGFRVESSVVPGIKYDDGLTFYEFIEAPTNRFVYKISDSVNNPQANGTLAEIPIWTSSFNLIQRLNFLVKKISRTTPMQPNGCQGKPMASSKKSKLTKFKELVGQKRVMFNFSDGVCHEEMIAHVKQALKLAAGKDKIQPLVTISHPKSFANEAEFEKFLNWASQQQSIEFATYQQFIRN